jgi:hypothetical protein
MERDSKEMCELLREREDNHRFIVEAAISLGVSCDSVEGESVSEAYSRIRKLILAKLNS